MVNFVVRDDDANRDHATDKSSLFPRFELKADCVKGLAFHPTQPLLAASLGDGTILLWNHWTGALVDKLLGHQGPVLGIAIHPSRPLLVSGGSDHTIKVWDIRPQSRRCQFTLRGHLDCVRTVQFHREMPWIVSASDDAMIRIWNSQSQACIAVLTGHESYVMSAQFHPKEDLVISASMDGTIRIWDISNLHLTPSEPDPTADRLAQLGPQALGIPTRPEYIPRYILEAILEQPNESLPTGPGSELRGVGDEYVRRVRTLLNSSSTIPDSVVEESYKSLERGRSTDREKSMRLNRLLHNRPRTNEHSRDAIMLRSKSLESQLGNRGTRITSMVGHPVEGESSPTSPFKDSLPEARSGRQFESGRRNVGTTGMQSLVSKLDETKSLERSQTVRDDPPKDVEDKIGPPDRFTLKHVLKAHRRCVNYAAFHPTLPLIISSSDDRSVKVWRVSRDTVREVVSYEEHYHNVSYAIFHPKREVVISCGEDGLLLVWDLVKRRIIQRLEREGNRFWAICLHPQASIFAAGHDKGLITFKLEREKPAYAVYKDMVYYVRDGYIRARDFISPMKSDIPLLNIRGFRASYFSPRALVLNSTKQAAVVVTYANGSASYELTGIPSPTGKDKTNVPLMNGKTGVGHSAVFISDTEFALLNKSSQIIEIRNVKNSLVRALKPPVYTIEIFDGGYTSLILSSRSSIILYDIHHARIIGQLDGAPVKSIHWRKDRKNVALLTKKSIIIAKRNFTESARISESTHIKSGIWDDCGAFIYSTFTHLKYCLYQGDCGIICTLERPGYLLCIKDGTAYLFDRNFHIRSIRFEPAEHVFKLALAENEAREAQRVLQVSKLFGNSLLAYAHKKGFSEIALQFMQETEHRFQLAIECGKFDTAVEIAKGVDLSQYWDRLALEALCRGNYRICKYAYRSARKFEKLSFLCFISGGLAEMAKLQDSLEAGIQLRNGIYGRDVIATIALFNQAELYPLAYLTARANGLNELAARIRQAFPSTVGHIFHIPLPVVDMMPLNSLSIITSEEKTQQWPTIDQCSTNTNFRSFASPLRNINSGPEDKEELYSDEEEWYSGDESSQSNMMDAVTDISPASPLIANTKELVSGKIRSRKIILHVLAGSFDAAMQLLYHKYGIRNFTILKSDFLSIWRSSQTRSFVVIDGLPPLRCRTERDVNKLPNYLRQHGTAPTWQSVQLILEEGYRYFLRGGLDYAKSSFRSVLYDLLFIPPLTKEELSQWQDLVVSTREYLLAVSIMLEIRALKKDEKNHIRRILELSAYLTHCRLQVQHLSHVLDTVRSRFMAHNNHAHAFHFLKRSIELTPDEYGPDLRHQVVDLDPDPNEVEISYDASTSFEVCAATYRPIYEGSSLVRCPFTGAAYLPAFKGTLDPLLELTEIGASTATVPRSFF